jgi:hypothetical protein
MKTKNDFKFISIIKDKFISLKSSIEIAHKYHSKFPLGTVEIEGNKIKIKAGYDINIAYFLYITDYTALTGMLF